MANEILENIKRIRALAETGLVYSKNEYDKERYQELHEISFILLSNLTNLDIAKLKMALPSEKDYPTAKVDIRAMILSDDKKILLVKESIDGKWSLPGGWGDIGNTPKEIAVKECKEETGLDVSVERLLAVYDKRMHPHPPQPFYVYKFVFYCVATSKLINKGFDVLDVQYFDINNLPELSEDRILKSQIELAYQKIISSNTETYFD